MGEVFLGWDTRLEKSVAVKALRRDLVEDPRSRERFVREARYACRVQHPFVCSVLDVVEDREELFLVMEHVEGLRLDDVITMERPSVDRVRDLAIEIAEALGAIHEAGLVHRDLKPSNVMVTGDGHVKVMDFGVARLSVPQRPALDVLHHEERHAVHLPDVEERDDVGVVEGGGRARLLLEAGAALGVGGDAGGEHLDRHLAPEPRVPRPEDLPHPSRTEGSDDLVGPEPRPCLECHAPAYFAWSARTCSTTARILSFTDASSKPVSGFLNASPQIGMSGPPWPGRGFLPSTMRWTFSAGNSPPLRFAIRVRSGGWKRRLSASGPSPLPSAPWQVAQ
jgi:serine/threonine protein kinase